MKEELTPRIIKKMDIIIFVNDDKQNEISSKILKRNISNLKGRNVIYCINKSDLINQKGIYKNEYMKINKAIIGNNEPIFVSAKTGKGINELKDVISEIAQKKFNNDNTDDNSSHLTSATRPFHGTFNLDDIPNVEQNHRNCWREFCDTINSFFGL